LHLPQAPLIPVYFFRVGDTIVNIDDSARHAALRPALRAGCIAGVRRALRPLTFDDKVGPAILAVIPDYDRTSEWHNGTPLLGIRHLGNITARRMLRKDEDATHSSGGIPRGVSGDFGDFVLEADTSPAVDCSLNNRRIP
jgi:hypothetical protein